MIAPLCGASKHSHRAYGRCRGADGAGKAEGRGGEEEAGAAMGAQPIGELGEIPELAEIDAEAEEAMRVEGEGGAGGAVAIARGMRLDGVIVGDEGDEPAVGHPLL